MAAKARAMDQLAIDMGYIGRNQLPDYRHDALLMAQLQDDALKHAEAAAFENKASAAACLEHEAMGHQMMLNVNARDKEITVLTDAMKELTTRPFTYTYAQTHIFLSIIATS